MPTKKRKMTKIASYFAVFEPAEEGGYNVSFPDFPGCVTFGRNFEHAKEMAQDVLKIWIESLKNHKKYIPARTSRPIIDEVRVSVAA
jgi:predicted RNase H-like HicB family nuclease